MFLGIGNVFKMIKALDIEHKNRNDKNDSKQFKGF